MSEYSIWQLEYAAIPSMPYQFLVYGSHGDRERRVPYSYVLIKGHGTYAMIDVGYDNQGVGAQMASGWSAGSWRSPREVLAEVGVTPEQIEHIFISHAHFDHMGNTDAFPNAKFYIQERELSKWIWAMSLDQRYRWLMLGTNPHDILRAVDLARQGRLVSIDGDKENILPGIDVHLAADTHTFGSMFITVRTEKAGGKDGRLVFAGDLVYDYENLHSPDGIRAEIVPIGVAIGSQANIIMAMGQMLDLVGGDYRNIVPEHEEKVTDFFPYRTTQAGLRVVEIALAEGDVSQVR